MTDTAASRARATAEAIVAGSYGDLPYPLRQLAGDVLEAIGEHSDRYMHFCPNGHWVGSIRNLAGEQCPVMRGATPMKGGGVQCSATLPPPDTNLDARIRAISEEK